VRGRSEKTKELIAYAKSLLEQDQPMTLRQLHYAIFSRNEIPYENTQAAYKRLSRVTTLARRAYRDWQLNGGGSAPDLDIPPSWMVDETRAPETVSCWDDVGGYLDTVKEAYRRDNWRAQPSYIEVWSEKATILGSIRRVTRKWGVTTRVLHGFGSTGMENEAGRLFESLSENEKDIIILFLGDHDPSGRAIERDIHRRVEAASGVRFCLTRLAIHARDIGEFNLPPQKIKGTDSRAAGFRRTFGDNAPTVELDALPADELRRRIDTAIDGLVDHDQWDRDLQVEKVEFTTIADVVSRVNAAAGGTA
jgi:hypothetical protein